jgi:hypothetical protein
MEKTIATIYKRKTLRPNKYCTQLQICVIDVVWNSLLTVKVYDKIKRELPTQ